MLSPFVSLFLSPGTYRPENNLYIDWSANILVTSISFPLCIPLVSEHMSSPHAPLCNTGPSSKSRVKSGISTFILLDYGNDQPVITNS